MKINLTRLPLAIFGVLFFWAFSSCSKKNQLVDEIYLIRGNAEPQTVNGSNESKAYGTIYGGYSPKNKKIAFNITWNELSSTPTGSCFYLEDNLEKVFPVTEGNLSGLTAGEMYLSNDQANELVKGNWSYSVNTINYPDGEIKGKMEITAPQ